MICPSTATTSVEFDGVELLLCGGHSLQLAAASPDDAVTERGAPEAAEDDCRWTPALGRRIEQLLTERRRAHVRERLRYPNRDVDAALAGDRDALVRLLMWACAGKGDGS